MIKLTEYANALVEKMKLEPDTFRDPDTSIEVGSPEIRVVIDRAKAADLGVRAGDVAQALNVLAAGQIVSTFSEGSKQYDVVVQADEQYRRDRSYLTQFSVSSSNTGRSQAQGGAVSGAGSGQVPAGTAVGTVPLDRVVRISEGLSPSSINRLNRLRQVTVSASLPPNSSEADAVAKIQEYAAQLQMPPEYITGVTGQSKELQKAYNAFLYAFLLSFVFMYLILAAQFESFIHPVTILLTLPLSVPFALLSTAIAGQTLNIFSALGILLLFGIVKKNAILQIDHTNTLRSRGMSRYDAIIQANRDRLRPILMTTIALVAGMLPLVLGTGAGAATNRSIGILVVGGQSLCLLLTLLAVPVFYSLFDDAGETAAVRAVSSRVSAVTGRLSSVLKRKRDAKGDEEGQTENG